MNWNLSFLRAVLTTIFLVQLCDNAISTPSGFARAAPILEWNGNRFRVDDLPDEVCDEAFDALEVWAIWASKHNYRLILSSDQRALLLVSAKKSGSKNRLTDLEEALKRLEELVGKSERSQDAVVLAEFGSDRDYRSFLEVLRSDYPHLEKALDEMKDQTGFWISHPPTGGWMLRAKGVEQWRPDHELIHRTSRLLLHQQFGELPPWISLGMAWAMEFSLRSRIHTFPYRDEFVKIGEHMGFEPTLRLQFRNRDPLTMEELVGWEDRKYESSRAAVDWGLTAFLIKYHGNVLPDILKDLALAKRRVRSKSGTVSRAVQRDILQRHAGEDLLKNASEWFRLGEKYRPE